MAWGLRCISLLAGLAPCLSQSIYDRAERFPLSGGLSEGFTVKIDFTSLFATEETKLEFKLKDGTTAFRLELFAGDKLRVERSTDIGWNGPGPAPVMSSGKFPLADSSVPGSIVILKTLAMFEVTINGERTPWFDFDVLSSGLVTHLVVWNGFEDAQVTMDIPECNTPCHPDECTDPEGVNVCSDADGNAVDASKCRATQMKKSSGATRIWSCRAVADVSEYDGASCCTGTPSPLPLTSLSAGRWVQAAGDQQFLDRACAAFGDSDCSSLAGKRAKIMTVNFQSDSMSLQVWSPDKNPQDDSALLTVPLSAAFNKVPLVKNFTTTTKEGMLEVVSKLNSKTMIVSGAPTAEFGGFPDKWFMRFVHERTTEEEGDLKTEAWVPYKDDLFNFWSSQNHMVQVVASDVDMPLPRCTDWEAPDQVWMDSAERTCAMYADTDGEPLCTSLGHETDKWRAIEGDKSFGKFAGKVPGGQLLYAPKACCVCGGGKLGGNLYEFPAGWPGRPFEEVTSPAELRYA